MKTESVVIFSNITSFETCYVHVMNGVLEILSIALRERKQFILGFSIIGYFSKEFMNNMVREYPVLNLHYGILNARTFLIYFDSGQRPYNCHTTKFGTFWFMESLEINNLVGRGERI